MGEIIEWHMLWCDNLKTVITSVTEFYLKCLTTVSTGKIGFETWLRTYREFGLSSASSYIELRQPSHKQKRPMPVLHRMAAATAVS